MDFIKEIEKIGLSEEEYRNCLQDIVDKVFGVNNLEWGEIKEKYNLPMTIDCLRKSNNVPFGAAFVSEYLKYKNGNVQNTKSTYKNELDNKLEQIRKEKVKLQTLNTERARIDRSQARQELYYENIGSMCQTLPLPDFKPIFDCDNVLQDKSYVLVLSDLHYGSTFKSEHNEYSREIFKKRLERVAEWTYDFVMEHGLDKLFVLELGDTLQGILRVSDLKINDTEVVKCIVEISRLLASFLNELSRFVNIEYYHVASANHSQLRPLGSKASEIADEDFEYVIGNYISDLLSNNDRVNVHLTEEGKQYVCIELPCHDVYAMHGHQFKSHNNALKDLSNWIGDKINTLILGHYHAGCENTVMENNTDCEVIVAPSMVGSDPYSDRLFRGSKAAVKIYGFDDVYGYTESYKCILN